MLHILLTVLKIILIILASLLGLILLILLVVLLVPFRYGVRVEKYDAVRVNAKLSWLLHAVSVPIVYDGGPDVRVKLFGFTVKTLFGDEPKEDEPDASAGQPELPEEKPRKKEKKAVKKDKEAENKAKKEEEKAASSAKEAENKASEDAASGRESEEAREEEAQKRGLFDRIGDIANAAAGMLQAIPDRIKGIFEKVKGVLTKISDIKNLIFEEHMKAAILLALSQVAYLLKKLLPRKVRGHVHFGMSDPAATGGIAAGLGAAYPLIAGSFEVVPDFEEEVFEGDVYLEGYFRLITLVIIAIRVIKDKNARYVIKKVMG